VKEEKIVLLKDLNVDENSENDNAEEILSQI